MMIIGLLLIAGLINLIMCLLLRKQGGVIMASLVELAAKVDELTKVQTAREERDVLQDGVTQEQITLLQATIKELRAIIEGGGLSAENQAIVDSAAGKIQATIDSLNAADPTGPVVV